MKKFKKVVFGLICLLYVLGIGLLKTEVYASTTQSDNGKGQWTPENTQEKSVYGMEHLSVWGTANGTAKQHVNVLSMKTDGYSSKLVTWAVNPNNAKYTRVTLPELAKDYEEKHPGWMVVGGINADQYTTGFGSDIGGGSSYFYPQTYYPLIMDGESRIPYTVLNQTNMHIGFANNGTSDSLVEASSIKGYVLSVVDEFKNVLATYPVDNINSTPSSGQTTVWSTYISRSNGNQYISRELTTNNSTLFVIEKPELAYMSNAVEYGGVNSFFGKGVISKVATQHGLVSNQFAIETSNTEVLSALESGKRVIVDAEYTSDALNQVEASTGYHSVHRKNNVDQPLVHTDYDGNRYSRAIVGKKADGTYVLLTADVATDPNDLTVRYAGLGFDECNATLKHYGVVEAYQMDGGGSVTSILRDENGEFVVTNYVRDGLRANMTGLLFVVRDPMVNEIAEDTTYHSVTFAHQDLLGGINSTIENLKVTFNQQEYAFENGMLTIDGLEENTDYDFSLVYDVVSKDGKRTQMETKISAKTKTFEGSNPNFTISQVGKTSLQITRAPNENIKNITVLLDDFGYSMGENTELNITGLIEDTVYRIRYQYEIYDETTGNTYRRETEETTVKTTTFEVPTIENFELYREYEDKVVFKYTYKDPDKKVTTAVLNYNEETLSLTGTTGMLTIKNLALATTVYQFQIVVTYTDDAGETKTVESIYISVGTTQTKHNITYQLDGGTNEEGAPVEYTEGIGIASLPVPTKEGYRFLGWYKGETKVESISKEETTDITLTAKWESTTMNEPKPKGCKCKKSSMEYILTLTTTLSLAIFLFRKKK